MGKIHDKMSHNLMSQTQRTHENGYYHSNAMQSTKFNLKFICLHSVTEKCITEHAIGRRKTAHMLKSENEKKKDMELNLRLKVIL